MSGGVSGNQPSSDAIIIHPTVGHKGGSGHFISNELDQKLVLLAKAIEKNNLPEARRLNKEVYKECHVFPLRGADVKNLKEIFPKGKALQGIREIVRGAIGSEEEFVSVQKNPLQVHPDSFKALAKATDVATAIKILKLIFKPFTFVIKQLITLVTQSGDSSAKGLKARLTRLNEGWENWQSFQGKQFAKLTGIPFQGGSKAILDDAFIGRIMRSSSATDAERRALSKELKDYETPIFRQAFALVFQGFQVTINQLKVDLAAIKPTTVPDKQKLAIARKKVDGYSRDLNAAKRKSDIQALAKIAENFLRLAEDPQSIFEK